MLFASGTTVRIKNTGDIGIVKALLEGDMVQVFILGDEMEIPVHINDLERAEDTKGAAPVKAKIVAGKKMEGPAKAPPIVVETQYAILNNYGIQLAFEAVKNSEGLVSKYLVSLINDTNYDAVISLKIFFNSLSPISWSDKLTAMSAPQVAEMWYDDLNEAPELEVKCNWLSTEGIGGELFKSLKIKPKSFFKSEKTAPLLNKPVHLYHLFERESREAGATEKEDLATYTKKNVKPDWRNLSQLHNLSIYDTKQLASFDPEIDLHIAKLTSDREKKTPSEILQIQLSHMDAHLAKAVRLGVPSIFIIHGVGKGRLKNEIATRLLNHPDVKTFKNDFHPRYGWGATEVIF
jgi:Smr domain